MSLECSSWSHDLHLCRKMIPDASVTKFWIFQNFWSIPTLTNDEQISLNSLPVVLRSPNMSLEILKIKWKLSSSVLSTKCAFAAVANLHGINHIIIIIVIINIVATKPLLGDMLALFFTLKHYLGLSVPQRPILRRCVMNTARLLRLTPGRTRVRRTWRQTPTVLVTGLGPSGLVTCHDC